MIWKGGDGPRYGPPPEPLGLTVGLSVQSFAAGRITEAGLLDRLNDDLRQARLFQGVMYPIPADFEPIWELRLLVRDEVAEADANFWKSALARVLFPLAFVTYFDTDYTLTLEALLTRNGEVVGSYASTSPIQYRFQVNTNVPQMETEGLELIMRRASTALIAEIARDAERIESEARQRAGS